jgi:hypothetical protein
VVRSAPPRLETIVVIRRKDPERVLVAGESEAAASLMG